MRKIGQQKTITEKFGTIFTKPPNTQLHKSFAKSLQSNHRTKQQQQEQKKETS